jgi:outer membrane lipoprotein-sorting protein
MRRNVTGKLEAMRANKQKHFLMILGVTFLLAIIIGCTANRAVVENEAAASPSTSNARDGESSNAAVAAPIAWNEVTTSYDRVKDYTCLYLKEERAISNGELQTIRLAFRKPLDVRLDWLNNKGKVDQTAVYRQGLNDGKLLARQSGLMGALAGTVKLKPDEPLALEDSRHPITEAGLGGIIENIRKETTDPQVSNAYVGEELIEGHPAWKFVFTTKTGMLAGGQNAARSVVWIDKGLKLPVQVEIYDRANALLERHRFKELKLNVGLTDQTFKL